MNEEKKKIYAAELLAAVFIMITGIVIMSMSSLGTIEFSSENPTRDIGFSLGAMITFAGIAVAGRIMLTERDLKVKELEEKIEELQHERED